MHWLLADILAIGFTAVVTLALIIFATYIGYWISDKKRR